jgi:RNA polymerase sigma factor (sigma-70 family)
MDTLRKDPKEIAERLRDEDGWEYFAGYYSDTVYTITRYRISDEESAGDVFLGVMEQLHRDGQRKLKSFRGDSSFETWLSRVVINCANDFFEKRKRNDRHHADWPSVCREDGTVDMMDVPDVSYAPEQLIENASQQNARRRAVQILNSALDSIAVGDRRLCEMWFYDCRTARQIAESEGTSDVGAIYRRIAGVVSNLRDIIAKHNILFEDVFAD